MSTSPVAAHLRAGLLIGLVLGAMPACTQAPGASTRRVVAQFTGTMDGPAGTLIMRRAPVGLPGEPQAAFGTITDGNDGTAGSGPANTVELVTEGAPRTGQAGCGRADSVCADVTLRSFFAGNELHNVFVEITSVSSGSNLGFSNTADPTGGQPGTGAVTSASGALWAYPALLDSTRGTIGGAAPGANAATRTWYFNNAGNSAFTFSGRVMADVTGVATGLQALCGVVPTSLNTVTNCGECLRSAPGGTTCNYTNVEGSTQATSRLDVAVTCSSGTACDTANSRAFTCRNLQTDASNCGVCGNSCGAGNGCSGGVCTSATTCSAGTKCGTVCCPGGSTCTAGLCILSDANEVSVGSEHACATTNTLRIPTLSASGTPATTNNVVCWGTSWWNGELLPGSLVNPTWTQGTVLPEFNWGVNGSVDHLVSGGTVSAGLVASGPNLGVFWAWGTLWNPNSLDGADTFGTGIGMVAGGGHTCLVERSSTWCFTTDNAKGQLGNGTSDLVPDSGGFFPHVVPVDGTIADNVMTGNPGARFLVASLASAGGDTTCAVLAGPGADPEYPLRGADQTAGTVACWGDNSSGKAGRPVADDLTYYYVPRLVTLTAGGAALQGATQISVGGSHVVALLGTNTLAFWGTNAKGQFGDGSVDPGNLVKQVTPAHTPVTSVAAGQDFTCYTSGGKVYCAGANDRGQLGDGTTTERHGFVEVAGLSNASSVRAGGVPRTGNPPHGSACAVDSGHVYCWGDNTHGQVGAGTGNGFYTTPQPVQLAPLP